MAAAPSRSLRPLTDLAMTTLSDIVRDLRSFDEEPVSWQEPTIYAEEPWTAASRAIVCWSTPKGGLPDEAAKLRLGYFIDVRSAARLLDDKYDQLLLTGRYGELSELLITAVKDLILASSTSRDR
jgi:hypothetical protein